MGRPKLIPDKVTEVPETLKILPTNEFCLSCKNSDIRKAKDTIIVMFNTMAIVAEQLDIMFDDWEDCSNRLRKWARAEKKDREEKANKKKRELW